MPQNTLAGDLGGGLPAKVPEWPYVVIIVLPDGEHEPGVSLGVNRVSFRHSSLSRPLKLSAKPFCIGLPGRCNAIYLALR
jgi:hypothetical protein